MSALHFTDQHEWVRIEGDVATMGITSYAAEQLGDVVFVELPEIGRALTQFGEAAVVESVKAASEVYAPLAGEVLMVNEALKDAPQTVNEDPEGRGWFVKFRVKDEAGLAKLMNEAAYRDYVKGL